MIDFRKVIEALNREKVEFVLIGGAAMIVHGSAYVTRDVDICYGRSFGTRGAAGVRAERRRRPVNGAVAVLAGGLDPFIHSYLLWRRDPKAYEALQVASESAADV